MRYNRLGNSGLQVSAIGLGNWNTAGVTRDKGEFLQVLHAARDAGVNLLDTADTYGLGVGESVLGEFLQATNRDEFVVATKMFFPISQDPNDRGLSRKHIVCSVNRSLRHLRTDYIDILQCHRFDEHTPLEETIAALNDLIRQGKILYWGVSRFSDKQMLDCHDIAKNSGTCGPISNQYVYNLLERRVEQTALPVCRALGVGIVGYSPLAQGVLTGKYLQAQCPADSRGARQDTRRDMWQLQPETEPLVRRLQDVAQRHGLDLATLALAWCLRLPGVAAVLTGASTPEQIRHNARACDVELTAELLNDIDGALRPANDVKPLVSGNHLAAALAGQGSQMPCS